MGEFLASDQMNRRIERGAAMLSHREIVPLPGWPAFVVAGHFLYPERRTFSKFRWHDDGREFRRQRVRRVDHPNRTGCQGGGTGGERTYRPGSLSGAFNCTSSRPNILRDVAIISVFDTGT
jgi:hypothetical protein